MSVHRMPDQAMDERWLREAFTLARDARRAGNRPFGAVLVSAAGELLGTGANTQVTTADCTGHAELNLIRDACPRLTASQRATATLYASGEPCPMCAAAIFWSGIGRVVFGASSSRLQELEGPAPDQLRLSCREVLAAGGRAVAVAGPILEAEALAVFDGYFLPGR